MSDNPPGTAASAVKRTAAGALSLLPTFRKGSVSDLAGSLGLAKARIAPTVSAICSQSLPARIEVQAASQVSGTFFTRDCPMDLTTSCRVAGG